MDLSNKHKKDFFPDKIFAYVQFTFKLLLTVMRLGKILVKPNYQIPKKFTCLNCPIRLMKREKTVLSINQPLIVPPLCSFWSNLLIRNHVFYLYYYFVVTNGCSYIPSLYIIRDIGSSAFHRKMFLVTINSIQFYIGIFK